MSAAASRRALPAPFFEDLEVGMRYDRVPGVTLTEGLAAAHQAIVGDRLALALDVELSHRVTGGRFAHPALVWDVAIGQSTVVTQRVRANLFYRGLQFFHAPEIGDTLRTETEIVALRENRVRADRDSTGLALLRVTTRDQRGATVLDFHRCAMLPFRAESGRQGRADDITADGLAGTSAEVARGVVADWDLEHLPGGFPGAPIGAEFAPAGGDVVSSAPELARLTLNIALAHHDDRGDRRLVYGGHTIGVALAQAVRVLPGLVTVLSWHSCDHLGPVYEGDTLRSTVVIEDDADCRPPAAAVTLRSRVWARSAQGQERQVLDWRFVALFRR